MSKARNIKNGWFAWGQKGAIEKIEKLPFRQQLPCKGIYWALCTMSAKQKNSPLIYCYKFDLARFASITVRTLYRYLPIIEKIGIITIYPQEKNAHGRFNKTKILLIDTPPLPCATSSDYVSDGLGTLDKSFSAEETQKPVTTSSDYNSAFSKKRRKENKNSPTGNSYSLSENEMYKDSTDMTEQYSGENFYS